MKERGLTVNALHHKTSLRRGFALWGRQDECLSTTLFMKESGLTVSVK
ncbi:hypothetical protein [Pectobacterium brasiliense]|nr:hypothetical protein [Pectobacterium brasiliense]